LETFSKISNERLPHIYYMFMLNLKLVEWIVKIKIVLVSKNDNFLLLQRVEINEKH